MNLDPGTRSSLLIRLRNSRDEEAWTEFIGVYEPVIYRMARRRGMQDADAREIVQEVLVAVSSAIDRFDVNGTGAFRGWLSKITRNATIDRLRRIASRGETVDASGVIRHLDAAAGDEKLADEFDQDHREQLFRWAASQVRRRTDEVKWIAFWRTSVEGMSIRQVAKDLGLEEGMGS